MGAWQDDIPTSISMSAPVLATCKQGELILIAAGGSAVQHTKMVKAKDDSSIRISALTPGHLSTYQFKRLSGKSQMPASVKPSSLWFKNRHGIICSWGRSKLDAMAGAVGGVFQGRCDSVYTTLEPDHKGNFTRHLSWGLWRG